jgi:hypothetical protein
MKVLQNFIMDLALDLAARALRMRPCSACAPASAALASARVPSIWGASPRLPRFRASIASKWRTWRRLGGSVGVG